MFQRNINLFNGFPKELIAFIYKVLILFLAWKLAYHFYLWPNSTLDEPLTKATANGTVKFLNLFSIDGQLSWSADKINIAEQGYYAEIFLNNKKIIGIAEACNALELMVLYVGLIICLPTSLLRTILFIIGGLIGIYVLNILRCAAMFELSMNKSHFFSFAHHYGFTLVVYSFIFLLWVWYAKALKNSN